MSFFQNVMRPNIFSHIIQLELAEATKQYFYKNWAKSSTSMKLGMMVPYSVLKNPRWGTHLNFRFFGYFGYFSWRPLPKIAKL